VILEVDISKVGNRRRKRERRRKSKPKSDVTQASDLLAFEVGGKRSLRTKLGIDVATVEGYSSD